MRRSLSRRHRRSRAQHALEWRASSGGRKGAARPAFGAALIARGLELSERAHRFCQAREGCSAVAAWRFDSEASPRSEESSAVGKWACRVSALGSELLSGFCGRITNRSSRRRYRGALQAGLRGRYLLSFRPFRGQVAARLSFTAMRRLSLAKVEGNDDTLSSCWVE